MKFRLLLFSLLAIASFNDLLAVPPAYTKLPDGVILITAPLPAGSPHAAKPEVIENNARNDHNCQDNDAPIRAGDISPR